jgi:hypothetical protein
MLSLAIAQLAESRIARAEPELSLHWSAPSTGAGCPDRAWALDRIAAQLGRSPRADAARGVQARVEIATAGSGFVLSLHTTWNGETGQRTLQGAHCSELGEAAILIIGLSVNEASEQESSATKTAPAGSSAAAGGAAKTGAPPTPRSAPSRLGAFVRAEAVLGVGLWNRPAFGPGLALALELGMFRAEISGSWFPPLTIHKQGLDIDASLGAARASGCLLFGQGRVRGGGCLGVEFGGARTNNAAASRQDHTWWGAGLLGGRLHVQLISRLSLVASADLLLALTRLSFASVDAETGESAPPLHQSQLLQLRASLGPELRF